VLHSPSCPLLYSPPYVTPHSSLLILSLHLSLSSTSPSPLLPALRDKIPARDVSIAVETLKQANIPVVASLLKNDATSARIENLFIPETSKFSSDTKEETMMGTLRSDAKAHGTHAHAPHVQGHVGHEKMKESAHEEKAGKSVTDILYE
jgi:hypothetical protein